MATCQICKYAGNPKDKYPCSDCKGYSKYEYEKPQTNADRIRAMSNEELAEYFGDCLCPRVINCSGPCNACIMEWLSKPAEDNDG